MMPTRKGRFPKVGAGAALERAVAELDSCRLASGAVRSRRLIVESILEGNEERNPRARPAPTKWLPRKMTRLADSCYS